MSLRKTIGIQKNNGKSLITPAIKNGSYIIIRNKSYDDTVFVLQEFSRTEIVNVVDSSISDKVNKVEHTVKNIIKTPIYKGGEASFLIENNKLRFELHSDIDYTTDNIDISKEYKALTAILNRNDADTENENTFIIDVVNAKDYYRNTTLQTRGKSYTVSETDESLEMIPINNEVFPNPQQYTARSLVAAAYYKTYFAAGRGFYLRNVTGLNFKDNTAKSDATNILKQIQGIEHNIGVSDESEATENVVVEMARIPYMSHTLHSEFLNNITNFAPKYGAVGTPNQDIKDYKPNIGDAFLILEPSIHDANKINALNFVDNSKLETLGFRSDGAEPFDTNLYGFVGDNTDHKVSQNYILNAKSKYQFSETDFDKELLKGIAVDIRLTDDQFPIYINFTAPSFTGIIFESETSAQLVMKDRKTKYTIPTEYVGKLNRYLINYEKIYLQLYINGNKIEADEQSTVPTRNFEINTLGLDVKSGLASKEQPSATYTIDAIVGSPENIDINLDQNIKNENDYKVNLVRTTDSYIPLILLPFRDRYSGHTNKGYVPFGHRDSYMAPVSKLYDETKEYNETTNPRFLQMTAYEDNVKSVSLSLDVSDTEQTEFTLDRANFVTNASDTVKVWDKTSLQVVSASGWSHKGSIPKEVVSTEDGYTIKDHSNIKAPNIYTQDLEIPTDGVATLKLSPAILATKNRDASAVLYPNRQHKCVADTVYKLIPTANEVSPLSADTALGTKTMQPYFFLCLDNENGQIPNNLVWKTILTSFLDKAEVNFIYADKNETNTKFRPSGKAGYRGVAGTAFPQMIDSTPTDKSQEISYDGESEIEVAIEYGAKLTITLTGEGTLDSVETDTEYATWDVESNSVTMPNQLVGLTQIQITATIKKDNSVDKTVILKCTLSEVAKEQKEFDKTIGFVEFKFNPVIDNIVGCQKEIEGEVIVGYSPTDKTPIKKFYKATMISFASVSFQPDTEQHENVINSGLGYKGCLIIYQLAETEADKNDYIGVNLYKSTDTFSKEQAMSEVVLESYIGQVLASGVTPLLNITKDETDEITSASMSSEAADINQAIKELNPLFQSGIQEVLDEFIDYKLTDLTLASEIAGIYKHIEYDAENTFSADYFKDLKYPRMTVDSKVFPAQGSKYLCILSPNTALQPNVIQYTKNDIIKTKDGNIKYLNVTEGWDNVGMLTKSEAVDYITALADLIKDTEGAEIDKTQISSNIDTLWAKVFTGIKRDIPYISIKDLFTGDSPYRLDYDNSSATDNNKDIICTKLDEILTAQRTYIQLAYVRFATCRFAPNPIHQEAITDKNKLHNPALFLWRDTELTKSIEVKRRTWEKTDVLNYQAPTGDLTAELGSMVMFAKDLTEDEVAADFKHAKVWRDYNDDILSNQSQVNDLHSLADLDAQMSAGSTPKLNQTLSQFAKNLSYGRVQNKKIPQGARFFINLWKNAWTVSDSEITDVGYSLPEDTKKYYFTEEVYNPDLDCTTVWFIPKEGVIARDYWTKDLYNKTNGVYSLANSWYGVTKASPEQAKNIVEPEIEKREIPLYIEYTATAENGNKATIRMDFKITKPVIFGLETIEVSRSASTTTLNGTETDGYTTNGSYMTARLVNKSVTELAELGILQREAANIHITCLNAALTPSRFCYKDNLKKVYRIPRLLWMGPASNLAKKTIIPVKSYDGTLHNIPSPNTILSEDFLNNYDTNPFGNNDVTKIKDEKDANAIVLHSYSRKADGTIHESPYVTGNTQQGVMFYAPFAGYRGVESVKEKCVGFRLVFKITGGLDSTSKTNPLYLQESTNVSNNNNRHRVSVYKDTDNKTYIEVFAPNNQYRFPYQQDIVENHWYYLDYAEIAATSDFTISKGTYAAVYEMWLLDTGVENFHDFDKSKVKDRSNWTEIVSENTDTQPWCTVAESTISQIGQFFIRKSNNNASLLINVDECVTAVQSGSNVLLNTQVSTADKEAFINKFFKEWAGTGTSDNLETVNYDKNDKRLRDENLWGAKSIFGSAPENTTLFASGTEYNHRSQSSMLANYVAPTKYTALEESGMPAGQLVGQINTASNYTPIGYINPQYDNMVEGYIEAPAMILDKNEWVANKSLFTQWLDNEIGLPYATDYTRQVRAKKLWDTQTKSTNNFAYKDSINYEPKYNEITKQMDLTSPTNKKWDYLIDYIYEMYQYRPRFHYVNFSYIYRDPIQNIMQQRRVELISMAEFEVSEVELTGQYFDNYASDVTETQYLRSKTPDGQTTGQAGIDMTTTKSWQADVSNVLGMTDTERINLGSGKMITKLDALGMKVNVIQSQPHHAFVGQLDNLQTNNKSKVTPLLGYWQSASPVQDMPSVSKDNSVSEVFADVTAETFTNGIGTMEQAVLGKETANAVDLSKDSPTIRFKSFAGYGGPSSSFSGRSPALLATARMCYLNGFYMMDSLSHIRTVNKGTIWEYLTPSLAYQYEAESYLRMMEAGGRAAMNRPLYPIDGSYNADIITLLSAPGKESTTKRIISTTKPYNIQSAPKKGFTVKSWGTDNPYKFIDSDGKTKLYSSGSGVVEATIRHCNKRGFAEFYALSSVGFPKIDYGYFNPTKDSAVISSAIVTPANYSNQKTRICGYFSKNETDNIFMAGAMANATMYRGQEKTDRFALEQQYIYGNFSRTDNLDAKLVNKVYVPIGHKHYFDYNATTKMPDFIENGVQDTNLTQITVNGGTDTTLAVMQPGQLYPIAYTNTTAINQWTQNAMYRNWNIQATYGTEAKMVEYASMIGAYESNYRVGQYTNAPAYNSQTNSVKTDLFAKPMSFYTTAPTTSVSFAMTPPSQAQDFLTIDGSTFAKDITYESIYDVKQGYTYYEFLIPNNWSKLKSKEVVFKGAAKNLSRDDKMNWIGQYICLLQDGIVEGEKINPNNFRQTLSGKTVTAAMGDVMTCFPNRIGVHRSNQGPYVRVLLTNQPDHPLYNYDAFNLGSVKKDKLYVGTYKASYSGGKIYSRSQVGPCVETTIGSFRTYAKARGYGYSQMTRAVRLFLQDLYCFVIGNLDSQTTVGQGISTVGSTGDPTATLGSADTFGMNNEKTTGKTNTRLAINCLGIQDLWGNAWEWVDGLVTKNGYYYVSNDYDNFNDTGEGYTNTGVKAPSALSLNILSVAGDNQLGTVAIEVGGSNNADGYCDSLWIGSNCVALSGGGGWDGAGAGVFALAVNNAPSIAYANRSARLIAL